MICNRWKEGCWCVLLYHCGLRFKHNCLWLTLLFCSLAGLSPDLTWNNTISSLVRCLSAIPPTYHKLPWVVLSFKLSLLLLLLSHSASSMLLGWVDSPGYPNGYSPHASLNWSRCVAKGHTLSLRLIHLDLEDSQDCENDAVKVSGQDTL